MRSFLLCACFLITICAGVVYAGVRKPTNFGFNIKDSRYSIKIKRLICESNSAFANFTHCIMKLERNSNGRFSIAVAFAAIERKLMLKVDVLRKSSANIYRPTLLQQSMDLCDFIANKNQPSLLKMFVPTLFEIVQIPNCPLKDLLVLNFTVPALNIDPVLAVTGDHKLILNITRPSGVYLGSIAFETFVKGIKTYE